MNNWTIHHWTVINRPHGSFWMCSICAMSAGPAKPSELEPGYLWGGGFLAGTPLYNLGYDCDIAGERIIDFTDKHPEYKDILYKEREVANTVTVSLPTLPAPLPPEDSLDALANLLRNVYESDAIEAYPTSFAGWKTVAKYVIEHGMKFPL
jgi:hypothetical protein